MNTILIIYLIGCAFSLVSLKLEEDYGDDYEFDLFVSNWAYWVFWIILSIFSWLTVISEFSSFAKAWYLFLAITDVMGASYKLKVLNK